MEAAESGAQGQAFRPQPMGLWIEGISPSSAQIGQNLLNRIPQ
jgi:hypothetical protein